MENLNFFLAETHIPKGGAFASLKCPPPPPSPMSFPLEFRKFDKTHNCVLWMFCGSDSHLFIPTILIVMEAAMGPDIIEDIFLRYRPLEGSLHPRGWLLWAGRGVDAFERAHPEMENLCIHHFSRHFSSYLFDPLLDFQERFHFQEHCSLKTKGTLVQQKKQGGHVDHRYFLRSGSDTCG